MLLLKNVASSPHLSTPNFLIILSPPFISHLRSFMCDCMQFLKSTRFNLAFVVVVDNVEGFSTSSSLTLFRLNWVYWWCGRRLQHVCSKITRPMSCAASPRCFNLHQLFIAGHIGQHTSNVEFLYAPPPPVLWSRLRRPRQFFHVDGLWLCSRYLYDLYRRQATTTLSERTCLHSINYEQK